jgi:hypothetical protein
VPTGPKLFFDPAIYFTVYLFFLPDDPDSVSFLDDPVGRIDVVVVEVFVAFIVKVVFVVVKVFVALDIVVEVLVAFIVYIVDIVDDVFVVVFVVLKVL